MKTRCPKEKNYAMFSHRLFGKMEWSLLMGILFLLLLSLFIRSAWAAEPQRLQRDLGVMEDVLESLCAHSGDQQTTWGSGPQARGLYLKGYGLLFLVEGCLPSSSPENVLVSVVRKEGGEKIIETKGARHVVKVVKRGQSTDKEAAEAPAEGASEDPLEKTRELIVEFLGNYADITNQLSAGEKITVLLRPGDWHLMLLPPMPPMPPLPPLPGVDNVEFDFNFQSAENIEQLTRKVEEVAERLRESGVISDSLARRIRLEVEREIKGKEGDEGDEETEEELVFEAHDASAPVVVHRKISQASPQKLLAATVKKSDVVAYRQGKLTEEQFRQRVDFQEHDLRSQETKSVDIMAGILDKALDGETHHRRQSGTLGIYQKGLGALFFVSQDPPSDLFAFFHEEEAQKGKQRRYLNSLEKQLFDALATYGPTLRPVQPGEYVIVELRFSPGFNSKSIPSRLILKVSKEDIDAYQQRKIDLDEFHQKSELQEL
jgi:hypothetical protein